MSNESERNCSSTLPFVTLALVGVASLLRIVVGNSDNTTTTVSFLNIIMMAYVLYRVTGFSYNEINDSSFNDCVKKNQVKAFKLFRGIVWGAFIVLSALYVILQMFIVNEGFFCIANDIIAIISFGCSIEEETIEKKLITCFTNNTFM